MTTATPTQNPTRYSAHTNYIVGAWVLLMSFTVCTWWLGARHDLPGLGRDASMISILVLTFCKVFVVGHSFMELRQASRWLVVTFTTWCIGLCAVMSFMYLSV